MILADYDCPLCGLFEVIAEREPNGEAPDFQPCPTCQASSPWSAAAVFGKVKATEVIRGGWAKPDHPGYVDTRELGEGMPLDEWREKRRKIRDDQRKKEIKELIE